MTCSTAMTAVPNITSAEKKICSVNTLSHDIPKDYNGNKIIMLPNNGYF